MEPTLPLDVLLHIIDLLAAAGDDEDSIRSLQILSQTCKYMVPLCRKHLFSTLCLHDSLTSRRFSNLLYRNPDIAHYVRSLNYDLYYQITSNDDERNIRNILNTLKVCSPLQSIGLSSSNMDWNNFPESIRLSLLSLIEMPTVTHLNIDSLGRFPATALSGCSNLINLQLGHLELTLPESNHVISRSKIPTPVSLDIRAETSGFADLLKLASLHASGPINFSRVQIANFQVESQGAIDNIKNLIKMTTRLEYIYIMMHQPLELAGLGESLAINAYQTLTSMKLSIPVVGDDYDSLCGLCRELAYIAGNNILEEIQLDMVIQVETPWRTEDWSAFDSVLTESGAFPILHRVSVEIWWYSVCNDQDDQEAMFKLESLQEDKFPRLVESKAVEFTFSAEIHYIP